MEKLTVDLENCYGIKKLQEEFDFSECQTFVIYAPNGVMKTSFSKTLKDIANKKIPCDQADKSLISKYDFLVAPSNTQIKPEEICVIESYNEKAFDSADKILTLLADEDTRNEYLAIYNEIETLKKGTLSSLRKISGSSNYEKEIIESFSNLDKENIFEIFEVIFGDITSSNDTFNFSYNHIFDDSGKVQKFLEDNFEALTQYIEKYNHLMNNSEFFKNKDGTVFGTTEAKNLESALTGDAYFNAGHKLTLSTDLKISDKESLSNMINEERDKILADPELKKIFDNIDNKLNANKELRDFKKVLEKDQLLLLRLENYEEFRREVWYSFLKQIKEGLKQLVELYNDKKEELQTIIKKAQDGHSAWQDAIDEFKNRFINMPFSIEINNKADAVLNAEVPTIHFEFHGKPVERKELVDNILSQGEKRAFYLLNVIFEIKARQKQQRKTLFVIDDIADSFDYKNKYAIVEYLSDISQDENFYSIVLTHNFDFYRTISGRLLVNENNRIHAEKRAGEIILREEQYQTDPFQEWKRNLTIKNIIALIPFVRNLVEYGINDKKDFMLLTHLLHKKTEIKYFKNGNIVPKSKETEYDEISGDFTIRKTEDLKFDDIKKIFERYLGVDISINGIDLNDSIHNQITTLKLSDYNESSLENKVVLAIAIRLSSEEFMINKIDNINYVNKISRSQTADLIKAREITMEKETLDLLESVNIMTPENIHLNSFMYEPILDMGIDELKVLHGKVFDLVAASMATPE